MPDLDPAFWNLCELLLSNNEAFPELVDAVLPLMTRISQGSHLFYHDETNAIINNYPKRFLKVLHTVLPENVSEWPYGIGEKLETIAEADNSLRSDPRLVELNRKWAAR